MATPKTEGITGTAAPSGYLQSRDRNPDVRGGRGYGTPGDIGEFLHLALTEPAIASCLNAMVLPIARGEWSIGSDEEQVPPEITDFIRRQLIENLKPDFRDLVRETTRAMLAAGFHVQEPIFQRQADGKIGLRTLAPRPAWTFARFGFDKKTGDLATLEQQGYDVDGNFKTVTLNAADLLIFTHEREGNDPTGKSMVRPISRDAKIKDFLKRLISIRNEREALGFPIGTYPATASKTEKDIFENFLAGYRVHERGYLMMPEGFSVTIPEGRAGSSDAIRADAAFLTTEIQSAFMQAWMSLGQAGSTSGGRAVGETQANPFYLALEAVMAEIAGPLDQLIRKLVDLNFGPQEYYPYVNPPELRPEDIMAEVQPILEAIKAGGVTVTPDVENELREELGLDERQVEPGKEEAPTALNGAQVTALQGIAEAVASGALLPEQAIALILSAFPISEETARQIAGSGVVTPAKPTEPQPPEPPNGGGGAPPPETVTAPEEAATPAPVEVEEAAAPAEMAATDDGKVALMWTPPRNLSPAELRCSFGEMVARLDAAPTELQQLIGNIMRRNQPAIARWIRPFAAKMAKGDFEALAKADLPKQVRRQIVDAVNAYAVDMREFGRMQAERERAKGPSPKSVEDILPDAPEAPATFADLPPDVQGEASVFGDRIADDLLRIARLAAMRSASEKAKKLEGILLSKSIVEDVAAAVEQLAQASAATKDAGLAVAVKALAGGRREVFEEDAAQIASVEYSAAMDNNTCEACREWDGKTAPSLEAADATFPPVPNINCEGTASKCRCLLVVDYK